MKLTDQEQEILDFLERQSVNGFVQVTNKVIAEVINCDFSTVSVVIKRLSDKGFIERETAGKKRIIRVVGA